MPESRTARIVFGGADEPVLVTPLGSDLYRLEETPLSPGLDSEVPDDDLLLWRGDTIEADALEGGALRYRGIAAKSPWRHLLWILAKDTFDSGAFDSFTEALDRSGGDWERVMGGVVLVHLPPDSTFDPVAELAARRQRTVPRPEAGAGD